MYYPIMIHLLRLTSLFTFLLIASPSFANTPSDVDSGDIKLFCELKAKTNNFLPGEKVQFEARVVNNSKQVVTNVRVVDFAPIGFLVEKSETVQVGEQVVLLLNKPIQPGKVGVIKFAAQIDEDLVPGLYTNLCKVVYAENADGEAIINEEQKWTSSPWSMAPTEALDFVRVLDPETNKELAGKNVPLYFKIIQTMFDKEKNEVRVDFSDDSNSSVAYKLFNDSDRLKSTGRVEGVEGLNTLNLDATYLEPGEYLLEMNDGTDSISTSITIQ